MFGLRGIEVGRITLTVRLNPYQGSRHRYSAGYLLDDVSRGMNDYSTLEELVSAVEASIGEELRRRVRSTVEGIHTAGRPLMDDDPPLLDVMRGVAEETFPAQAEEAA